MQSLLINLLIGLSWRILARWLDHALVRNEVRQQIYGEMQNAFNAAYKYKADHPVDVAGSDPLGDFRVRGNKTDVPSGGPE